MDADIEIGIIADRRRQVQRAIRRIEEQRFNLRPEPGIGEQRREPAAQCQPRRGGGCEKRIERGFRLRRQARFPQQPGCARGLQVENFIADRNARTAPPVWG